ncbi:MAG: tetratricopeptide repeat protein [Candidatus Ozemobacteraceae bacterium]
MQPDSSEHILLPVTRPEGLYQTSPLLRFIGMLIAVLLTLMATGSSLLLTLERPRIAVLLVLLAVVALGHLGMQLAMSLLSRFHATLSGVLLWALPLAQLTAAYFVFWILLSPVPDLFGRAVWSKVLDLNAKGTTLLFSNIPAACSLYIIVAMFVAAFRHLKTVFSETDDPMTYKERMAALDAERLAARRINRTAFWFVALLLAGVVLWFVKTRPETILFLRGQVQLQSMQHPEIALETFVHLARKYPEYRYRDTVDFKIAWIQERRMGNYDEAAAAYRTCIETHGYENVWSDDALANLIRVTLDKQKNATETLRWTARYREHFPDTHLAPHVTLYEVRALKETGRITEARALLDSARQRYVGRLLNIYDNEDDFVARIPFSTAADALGLNDDR